MLSTLHQSSLGSLYLIVPAKLHPLWYSSLLPLFFFISAVGAGLGMVILESYLSGRAFGRELEMDILEPLGTRHGGRSRHLRVAALPGPAPEWRPGGGSGGATTRAWMFGIEVGLGILLPIMLLALPRVRRHPNGLVAAAFLAVLGFVMYRLNVSVTGMERAAGSRYLPSWMEVVVSIGLVSMAFALFSAAVKYLPIFPETPSPIRGGGPGRGVRRCARVSERG